jgi:hypothetical protein
VIVPFTSRPYYAAHLAPIVARLPAGGDVALVAGYPDLCKVRKQFKRIVLAQHGAGQSYSIPHPHYPGGSDNDAVGLFLAPNEHAADRWRRAYPNAAVEVVGCARLDDLPARGPGPITVAIGFHWNCFTFPETRSTFAWYRNALREVAESFNVIGHGHPRARDLPRKYRGLGIEYVETFDEVCERADVYVCDNSSTLFEFAATGRNVVVLNAPWYRTSQHHGLRFWDAADVGPQVWQPDMLVGAIQRALSSPPAVVEARERALDIVYTHRTGGADRAAEAIRAWAA